MRLRRVLLMGALLIAIVGCWAAARVYSTHRMTARFHSILPGQGEDLVAQILGRPARIVEPRPSHWCDATPVASEHASANDQACVRQWQYDQAFTPACFSICFGADGKVRSTYEYASP